MKLADIRIPPDIRYVRMTDIERALTIYGHRANLLNNKWQYPPGMLTVKKSNISSLPLPTANLITINFYIHVLGLPKLQWAVS